MTTTQKILQAAAQENIITQQQLDRLMVFAKNFQEPAELSVAPKFDFTHVLYYLGGSIAIGAMTLFMNLGWESFGGWGIVAISITYALIGLALLQYFRQREYPIPAGICGAFVIALTPLAIYGFQHAMGWWPGGYTYNEYHQIIHWNWVYMELGTLMVGAAMIFNFRYPFLMLPIAVTLWYLSMDLAIILGGEWPDFEFKCQVSMLVGAAIVLLALWVDIRSRFSLDYAFWLFIFGSMAFWCGMTFQSSDSELTKLIYCAVNLLMIGIGVVLVRRIFVVLGGIGCGIYLGHLSATIFEDSWLFPISLSIIGLAIIYLGVLWQKNHMALTQHARHYLPDAIREMLENKRY